MQRNGVIAALFIAIVLPGIAAAGPLTYEFTGRLTEVFDPANIFGASVGDPFRSLYTLDPTLPDFDPLEDVGRYRPPAFMTTIGGVDIYDSVPSIFIDNSPDRDVFSIGERDYAHPGLLDLHIEIIEIRLEDHDAGVFNTGLHPLTPPHVNEFESNEFTLWGYDAGFRNPFLFSGEVDAWTRVPEPSSLWILGFGALVAMGSRHRASRRVIGQNGRRRQVMQRNGIIAALIIGFLVPGIAAAGPLTYEFTGRLTEVFDPANIFGASVGDPFRSLYTLDPTLPDFDPHEDVGRYSPDVFLTELGLRSIYALTSEVFIDNSSDSDKDVFDLDESDFEHRGLYDIHVEHVGVRLEDFDGTIFRTGLHPLDTPSIMEFESNEFTLWGYDAGFRNRFIFSGEVDSWSRVPEPSSLWILGLGALVAMGRRRRASRRVIGQNGRRRQVMQRNGIIAALIIAIVLPGIAAAGPLTYEFTGRLTEVFDPANIFGASVGDPFRSLYTLDPTLPDFDPLEDVGRYRPPAFMTTIGGVDIYDSVPGIFIDNSYFNPDKDVFSIGESDYAHPGLLDLHISEVRIRLEDHDAGVFNTGLHPLTPPPVSEFESNEFSLWGYDAGFRNPFLFSGEVDTWTRVPEPSSLWILGLGALVAMGSRHRASRRVIGQNGRRRQVMQRNGIIAALIIGFFLPGIAAAGPLTYEFTGHITEVDDPRKVLGVSVGSSFSSLYSLDPTLPDEDPLADVGRYNPNLFLTTIGRVEIYGLTSGVFIDNSYFNPDKDVFEIAENDFDHRGLWSLYIERIAIRLEDSDAAVFNTGLHPLDPPPIRAFESNSFILSGVEARFGDEFRVSGEVTSWIRIPEPSSLWALVFGVILVATKRRSIVQPLPKSPMPKRKTALRWTLLITLLTVCSSALADLTDIAEEGEGIIPAGFEPSGICWHPGNARLVVVGDDGDVAVMDTSGGNQDVFDPGFKTGVPFDNTYGGDDIEAVCMGPDLSEDALVYVGVERDFVDGNDTTGPRQIRALDLANEEYTAEWEIAEIGGTLNDGIEGMTFVPNRHVKDAGFASAYEDGGSQYQTGDFAGGLFFVAKEQSDPRIFVIDIDLGATNGTYTATGIILNPGFSRISGLDYNRDTRILNVLNGSANSSHGQVKLFTLGAAGTISQVGSTVNLPTDHIHSTTREGIAYPSVCDVEDGDDAFYA